MYDLQIGFQFKTILHPILKTMTSDKTLQPPIYLDAVLLPVHVFDCGVTGVPCRLAGNVIIIWNSYCIATINK